MSCICRSRDASGRVAATEHVVEPGSFLWISAGVTHDISRLDTSQALTMYHVRVAVQRRDGTPCRMPEDVIVLPHALAIHRLFEVWFGEAAHTRDNAGSIGLGLFLQTFGYLFAGLNKAAVGPRFTSAQQMAAAAPRQRSGHLPTPADLATRLGLSHTYFSRSSRPRSASPGVDRQPADAACAGWWSRRSITAIGGRSAMPTSTRSAASSAARWAAAARNACGIAAAHDWPPGATMRSQ